MICTICGINETDNHDGICNSCNARISSACLATDLSAIPVKEEFSGVGCPHCSAVFQHADELNRHIDAEHQNRLIQCIKCSEKFRYPVELKRHIKESHPYKPEDTSTLYTVELIMPLHKKKKPKRKQRFAPVNPPCFGRYGSSSCRFCTSDKRCKKVSKK